MARRGIAGRIVHDLTGVRFGIVTVLGLDRLADHRSWWCCRCDCGVEFVSMAQSLKSGATKTCSGTVHRRARMLGKNQTHGSSRTRTYQTWLDMRKRCTNPRDQAWPNYGGRGISVCARWSLDFTAFLADMGDAPDGLEIERIDNDRGYEPSNCRWSTVGEQANNKRNNRMVLHNGRMVTLAEYAVATGIKYSTAYYRKVLRDGAPHRISA